MAKRLDVTWEDVAPYIGTLSLNGLAYRFGVAHQTLSRWAKEHGVKVPRNAPRVTWNKGEAPPREKPNKLPEVNIASRIWEPGGRYKITRRILRGGGGKAERCGNNIKETLTGTLDYVTRNNLLVFRLDTGHIETFSPGQIADAEVEAIG